MNSELQSAVVRRHLRNAFVLGWTGYFAGLLAAVTLGVGSYALATGHVGVGMHERQDVRDQWYLRLALRTRYLRAHPEAVRRP